MKLAGHAIAAAVAAFFALSAHAQAPQRFTPDKPLKFGNGTPKARRARRK